MLKRKRNIANRVEPFGVCLKRVEKNLTSVQGISITFIGGAYLVRKGSSTNEGYFICRVCLGSGLQFIEGVECRCNSNF